MSLSRQAADQRRFLAGPPPVALYVHWPWCLRKCPYCDFNSHPRPDHWRQASYIDALLADLDTELELQPLEQAVETLFIGGGTPSLIEPAELHRLIAGIRGRLDLAAHAELTLEANPGAADAACFAQALDAGINRLSLGVQSLSDAKLKAIGRVHDSAQARQAFAQARQVGCRNINIDLMFGLPGQNLGQARADLQAALALEPEHLSYYQLTLEPGTAFERVPPSVPEDDLLADMAEQGQQLLTDSGYRHYEVSAFARPGRMCRHNLNYWTFGDYLGLGAGAHGKRTDAKQGRVVRRVKWADPLRYLESVRLKQAAPDALVAETNELSDQDVILEFALNALRLRQGVSLSLFEARAGLSRNRLAGARARAEEMGLLERGASHLRASARGRLFLNSLLEYFMTDPPDEWLEVDRLGGGDRRDRASHRRL
ncbi:Oxygen-independent coproporphyrinogen-III oxidase 1 [Thiorhodovibrio winogradskyi]|uniref:Heme chaperone HemW n=1 Tax=Thiorhodovibrio winogradskyi TaxID=77007 RepID=A0ABZ0S5N9_9GAMM|nr:radical SAM family heme chaperone HemW [Thiorhodovibrio winogradskyi]